MKKCLSCGLENPDVNGVCAKCGAVLFEEGSILELSDAETAVEERGGLSGAVQEPETLTDEHVSIPTVSVQKQPGSGKSKLLVLSVVAIGSLVLIIGAIGLIAYQYWDSGTIHDRFQVNPNANAPAQVPASNEISPTEKADEPPATAETTPEAAFTPPVTPTTEGSFTVSAAGGWQVSEIETVSEEIFRTIVKGFIQIDGIQGSVPPEGVSGNEERRVNKEFPTGALLIRTRYADGRTSNIAHATSTDDWENYPNESGRLEFMVNDNAQEKNKGEFVVTLTLLKLPDGKDK